jgi:hypothetical protein
MQPLIDEPTRPTFTAAIRWRGPNPIVQLETRHPGFEDVEAATHFAAGFFHNSPQGLRLSQGRVARIALLLSNGSYVDFPYDLTTAWIHPSSGHQAFESLPFSEVAAYPTANGDYKRIGYAVVGPDGSPVNMVIAFPVGSGLDGSRPRPRGGSARSVAFPRLFA